MNQFANAFYFTLKYSTVQHPHWIFTFLLLNCLFSIDENRVLARHGKPVVQEGLIFVDFFLQVGLPLQDTWTPFWPNPCMKAHFNPLSPISTYKFSKLISLHFLKNELREFNKISRNFLFGDHFINSRNLISWQCMDTITRKLMFVTIDT